VRLLIGGLNSFLSSALASRKAGGFYLGVLKWQRHEKVSDSGSGWGLA
jgi:hypothetical protein